MKQIFVWLMVAANATWALHAAYQLAQGWATAAQPERLWTDRANATWPDQASTQMLFVTLGLLSALALATYAASDRWQHRLRQSCRCGVFECHCTLDVGLLYGRPGADGSDQGAPLPRGAGG